MLANPQVWTIMNLINGIFTDYNMTICNIRSNEFIIDTIYRYLVYSLIETNCDFHLKVKNGIIAT